MVVGMDANQASPQRVAECLYRNHCGTYIALVKKNGKQIKRSLDTKDEALAKRRLREFRQKIERLAGRDQRNIRFTELSALWLQTKKPDIKESSYIRRSGVVKNLNAFFKYHSVRDIDKGLIESWKIKRATESAAATFNLELDTLNAILDYAQSVKGVILDNPCSSVKRRKLGKPAILIPSHAQFNQLVDELSQEPKSKSALELIELLAYSGMRLGEAVAVKWADINLTKETLTVTGGNIGTKNHEARVIPLFPPLLDLLKRIRATRGSVISSDSCVVQIDSAKKSLIGASQRAGLPRFGHHTMRHFFCSNAIEAGIDFKAIAAWLGHKDGGVLVAKTYGHLRQEHSFEMAKRLTFSARCITGSTKAS